MGFKLVSAVLMVALALSGPLAPVAWAQEKMDAQMAAAKEGGDGPWKIGAVAATVVNIPGRAVLCGLAGATGVAVLLVSFGSGYQWAGRAWSECHGPWIITVADVKGEQEETEFWSERPDYQK
jgi:hypothetical protein